MLFHLVFPKIRMSIIFYRNVSMCANYYSLTKVNHLNKGEKNMYIDSLMITAILSIPFSVVSVYWKLYH